MAVLIHWTLLAAIGQATVTPLSMSESLPIDSKATHHVQGLATSESHFYFTSVDKAGKVGWLFAADRATGKVLRSEKFALGDQYHPGGIQLRGGRLYVPLAEYRPKSTSTILVMDAERFRVERTIAVDDHIGAVAVDESGRMYLANWDAREIRVVDPAGSEISRAASPTGVAYQDLEWHDGLLWGCGSTRIGGKTHSIVDVIDPGNWTLKQRYELSGEQRSGGANFGREGLTKDGDRLLLLPEDGPNSTIYTFSLGG